MKILTRYQTCHLNWLLSAGSLPATNLSIPGVEMSDSDTTCYNIFVNTIVKSIGYPHCDPSFSPLTLLLPFVKTNRLVRPVALACGASALTYVDSRYDEEAKRRYACVNLLIIDELMKLLSGWSEPMSVCVQHWQTLSMRDKKMGLNITICAAHFSSAYAITKKRFLRMSISVFEVFGCDSLLRRWKDYSLNISFFIIHLILCLSGSKLKSAIPSPFLFLEQFEHVLNQLLHRKRPDRRLFNKKLLKMHGLITLCWELGHEAMKLQQNVPRSVDS